MNLKTIAFAFVFALVFFVAIVAAIVAASQINTPSGGDADVHISGLGGGHTINYLSAHRSARQFARLAGVPRISDETVQQLMKAIIAKAEQGDTECSMFVLELAATQRAVPTTRPARQ